MCGRKVEKAALRAVMGSGCRGGGWVSSGEREEGDVLLSLPGAGRMPCSWVRE